MSKNLTDQKQERSLFTKIADLESQIRQLRTQQVQGPEVTPITRYDYAQTAWDNPTPVYFTATISALAAGAQAIRSFSVRHQNPAGLITAPANFQPSVAVYVGTAPTGVPWNDASTRWPTGNSLTSGQLNANVSVVRDWHYGLTVQDPQTVVTWHVQVINRHSSANTYYLVCALYGPRGLGPLITELI
jgi:hypothetical protein